jgi:hypothetical protein
MSITLSDGIALCAAVQIVLAVASCTLPQSVQFAPLVTVEVSDTANGNTIPLGKDDVSDLCPPTSDIRPLTSGENL